MNILRPLVTAVTAASLALAGCASAPGQESIGSAEQQEVTNNALVANALVANALVANALVANALVANALVANSLTDNALVANALVANGLEDPNGRELFSYIVSCALPASSSVSVNVQGTEYTYQGDLGLAPQWGNPHGFCDFACQEWVSACLLARLDYLGVHREISVRGQNPALHTSAAEQAAYPHREATYFGNVFTAPFPQQRFACLSPGQTEISRVCGPSLQGCAVDVDATCDQVCNGPTADGAFTNCRPEDGDWDDFPYHGSITVYLP